MYPTQTNKKCKYRHMESELYD